MAEFGGLHGLAFLLHSGLGKYLDSHRNVRSRCIIFARTGIAGTDWAVFRYAFPPLLQDVIAKDIGLNATQLANSNIVALVAT